MSVNSRDFLISAKRSLQALLVFCCLLLGSSVFSNEQSLQPVIRGVHVENTPSNSRIIPSIERFKDLEQDVLVFDEDLSDGYWLKPTLPNGEEITTGHLFTIAPPSLHHIDMYIPSLSDGQAIISSGRFDIQKSSKFSHRANVFELPENFVAGSDVFFYTQSRSDDEIKIRYWEHDEYLKIDRKYSSLYSAVFASLLVLIVINFIFFLAIRDFDYFAYVFYLSSFLVFILITTNKIYEFNLSKIIGGNYNSTLFVYTLVCLSLTIFIQRFLNLKKFTPIFYRYTQFCVIFFSSILLMSLVIWPVPYIGFYFVNYFALVSIPFLLFSIVKICFTGNRQARYFMLAFTPLIIMIVLRILAVLNFIPHWDLALGGFQIATVFQALVLSIGLADQMLELRKERDEAQLLSTTARFTLQSEKEFSRFLTSITEKVRENPNENHDHLIISSFFERLNDLYDIDKAAIIYKVDDDLVVLSENDIDQSAFNDYVNNHLTEVSRACHRPDPRELVIAETAHFSIFTKMLLIPVHMRGHEWSGMLININISRRINTEHEESLQRFATELVHSLVNAHKLNHFSIKAETDDLTQLYNRGAVLGILDKEVQISHISQLPLSIAFLDIDYFKKINDEFGHEAGDTCLSYLALQIRRCLPDQATVGRMGGDEFLFIFPNHYPEQAKEILSTLSNSLETLTIDNFECAFTLSIGIAQYSSVDMNVKTFLRHADDALYKAKKNGRAQITIAA